MFKLTDFNLKVVTKNPNIGRFKKSELKPLQDILAGVNMMPTATQKAAIQEAIFNIPFDKQAKYAVALGYLATSCGVKICGCPVDPVMELESFRVSDYMYHAWGRGNTPILNISDPNHVPLHSLHHVFKFRYKSSTGNMLSLASVGTREHVTFRTKPGLKPFTDTALGATPMHFIHGQSTQGANVAAGLDDHMTKPPSLVCHWPLEEGELVADQWYQFTVDNGATWQNIPGAAYNLIKGVRRHGSTWVYYFIKKNWYPNNTLAYKFEAEYAIEPARPPADPTKELRKIGQATVSDINNFAHRVISLK